MIQTILTVLIVSTWLGIAALCIGRTIHGVIWRKDWTYLANLPGAAAAGFMAMLFATMIPAHG